MLHKKKATVRSIWLISTEYLYIDQPIEFHYFSKATGTWHGKSNLRKIGQDLPYLHIANQQDAFRQITKEKGRYKKDRKKSPYLYGIVINFKTHTVFYDNEEALARYFKDKFWIRDILKPVKKERWMS